MSEVIAWSVPTPPSALGLPGVPVADDDVAEVDFGVAAVSHCASVPTMMPAAVSSVL